MHYTDAEFVLGDGNHGAMSVIRKLWSNCPDFFEEMIRILHKNRIFGSKIWIIYKDLCKSDIKNFSKLLKKIDVSKRSIRIFYILGLDHPMTRETRYNWVQDVLNGEISVDDFESVLGEI